ncbi:MAG: hypothetical protein ACREKS_01270 [Candidatus Rokuibacteriota bacterium]
MVARSRGSLSEPRPDGQLTEASWRRLDPLLRISAQLYNRPQHYTRLAEALSAELAAERLRP